MALRYRYVVTDSFGLTSLLGIADFIFMSVQSLLLPLLEGPSPPCLSWGPAMESMVHQGTLRLLRLGNPEGHLSGLALLVILHGYY